MKCTVHNFDYSDDLELGCPWCEISRVTQQLETELQRNTALRAEMEKEVQRTADAYSAMHEARDGFRKASAWNQLTELELNNLRSLKEDLEGYLRSVVEHIAPMLKLYEPNLPEHPVIQSIREYLSK